MEPLNHDLRANDRGRAFTQDRLRARPYETILGDDETMTANDDLAYETAVLTTDRLLLRRFTSHDGALLFELDRDPEVRRFLFRTATPREEIEARILPALLAEYDRHPGFGQWLASDRRTAAFLGWFSLRVTDTDPRDAELGYRLLRAAWGHGYATEGGRALIARAFTDLGMDRVHAQTMAVNRGSRRVMEKCGMTHVRTFHEHFDDPLPGTEDGEVEYEIRYTDWMSRGG